MNLQDKLTQYIYAGYPIMYISSYEELKIDEMISNLSVGRKLIEWNGADGLVDFDTKVPLLGNKLSLDESLAYLNADTELDGHILILKDAHIYINNEYPSVVSLLKRICHRIIKGDIEATVLIVSSIVKIPKEIEKFITVFETDDMTTDDIKEYVKSYLDNMNILIQEKLLNEISIAFKGLTAYEIESLLNLSMSQNGSITHTDLKLIAEQKRQIIMKTNILEMINVKEKIEDIGGLSQLKHWLERKSKVYKSIDEAMKFGVDMPKGVLIAGIPGCGKSLTAKVTSALFEVPLLKLDMGKIMGKYLGESETNMRRAIKLAETISPCVLWVDELEKAFAGTDGSGHEVTMRLFAAFLTWLQEKTTPVFVVATANDISKMPPELLRKGRFDDIFYVDLPNDSERKNIFEIHIQKRRPMDLRKIDLNQLVKQTEGFSGADIEGVVVDAVENSFADGVAELTTEYLKKAITNTKSLSVIMKDQLNELRKFYKEKSHFKSAT